jgi:hypothetical protein
MKNDGTKSSCVKNVGQMCYVLFVTESIMKVFEKQPGPLHGSWARMSKWL